MGTVKSGAVVRAMVLGLAVAFTAMPAAAQVLQPPISDIARNPLEGTVWRQVSAVTVMVHNCMIWWADKESSPAFGRAGPQRSRCVLTTSTGKEVFDILAVAKPKGPPPVREPNTLGGEFAILIELEGKPINVNVPVGLEPGDTASVSIQGRWVAVDYAGWMQLHDIAQMGWCPV